MSKSSIPTCFPQAETCTPPTASRQLQQITQLGRTREDAYAWLRDQNWQSVMRDPERLAAPIRAYLEAENSYTYQALSEPLKELKDQLYQDMRARIADRDSSVPDIDGSYAYFIHFEAGSEYPSYMRKASDQAFDDDTRMQNLLDGSQEAQGQSYFDLGSIMHSPDHRKLAYSVDNKGSEYYRIHIRDLGNGSDCAAPIDNSSGDFVWAPDGESIYWVKRNEQGRSEAVYLRDLESGQDHLIYKEEDPGFFIDISAAQSQRFLFIACHDHISSEWHYVDWQNDALQAKCIAKRRIGVEYSVCDFGNQFCILTNQDNAVDFKIMLAAYDQSEAQYWREWVPYKAGCLILDVLCFKDFTVRLERFKALPRIVITMHKGDPDRVEEHIIAFEEAAYALSLRPGFAFDTEILRFTYASPAQPEQIFDYNMHNRERYLRKTQNIPSGHLPDDYIVERLFVPIAGERERTIPLTLLRHKSTPIDGTAPLMLYGYGSYGITISTHFLSKQISLVNRGMIYAIAHIRGSSAQGYQWYLDGKLAAKPNTFADYLACAHYLIDNQYTKAGRIVGMGGSAGGMLMGAVANMEPELFAGIAAVVPFVDVLNTMSDKDLPLTPPEWPEWGNPIEDGGAYDIIASYSPYDNVDKRDYPPMLITGGLTDPRVTYWEPAKWIAKLRYYAGHAGPYFLKMDMDAGHGGASGRYASLKEYALIYAFALASVGLADSQL